MTRLQHFNKIILLVAFLPMESRIGLVLYPLRAVADQARQAQAARENTDMPIFRQFRAALIGLIAIVGTAVSSATYADTGTIRVSLVKAGWFIGGSGGSGMLTFHGRRYPLSIGGLSAGLVFGASGINFVGTVRNIYRPSDVAGVYGAAGAGAAIVAGGGVIALTNGKGAVLSLSGRQVGLIANLDLSGMAISLR